MKNPLKTRWFIIAGIWLSAIGITYLNSNKIDAVRAAREQTEQVRKEIAFKRQHTKTLNEVHRSYEMLFYPVPSLTFGIITVEQQMRSLAADYGLQNVYFQKQMDSITNDQVQCRLSWQGAMEQVFQFLSEMPQYSYLPIRQLNLQVSPYNAVTKAEMEFTFQYRVVPIFDENAIPLHAFNHYFELKDNSL